eukprot:jgi/Botrbrau1/7344/Bobra.247_3s0037.1
MALNTVACANSEGPRRSRLQWHAIVGACTIAGLTFGVSAQNSTSRTIEDEHAQQQLLLGVAAGYMAGLLCNGLFVSNRTFDSVWENEGDIANGLVYQLFNLSDPAAGLGHLVIGPSNVTTSVGPTSHTFTYLGGDFGCQLQSTPPNATVGVMYVDDGKPPLSRPWMLASPNTSEAVSGLDYNRLDQLISDWFDDPVAQEQVQTRALVVVHRGKVVAEQYAEELGIGPDTPLISWSVAKSISSALLGLRVGDGAINVSDIAQSPIWSPEEAASRNITIQDLAQMTSGLGLTDDYSPGSGVTRMLYTVPDAAALVASYPQVYPPGTFFNYSTGNTVLLMYNLRRTFGGNDSQYWSYPRNRLFKPIGAESMLMEVDPSGTFQGGSSVYATARDYARFGQLYLQDGVWEGQRLLPEGWVQYSTTPIPQNPEYGTLDGGS